MSDKAKKAQLIEQRDALKVYLSDLLLEVEGYTPPPEVTAPNPAQTPPPADAPLQQQANADTTPDEPVTKPIWAERPFQVLTFEIAGVLYAVPLSALNGIVPMPSRLTRVPTTIPWFIGLFRNRDINVKVIDVEKLWQSEATVKPREWNDQAFIVLIDEGRFGFVVHCVKTILKVSQDDVQWRHQPGLNGVLRGNIVANMASLIDIGALIDGLHAGIWAGARRKSV